MGGGAPAFVAALAVLFVMLVIGTLIGAIILRAAVSLYNKLAAASPATSVPEPSMGKAMGITFVTTLVNGVAGFAIGFVIGGAAVAARVQGPSTGIIAQLVSLPVSFLVMSGMLAALLPTTFVRAMLVTLCFMLIGILICVGIGIVVALCTMAFMAR